MTTRHHQLDPFTHLYVAAKAFSDAKSLHRDLVGLVNIQQKKMGVAWFGVGPTAEVGAFEVPWPTLLENIRSRVQLLSMRSYNSCQLLLKPKANELTPFAQTDYSSQVVLLPIASAGTLTLEPSENLRTEADFYMQAHGDYQPHQVSFKAGDLLFFDGQVDKWWDYTGLRFNKSPATLLVFRDYNAGDAVDIASQLPNYRRIFGPDDGRGVFVLNQVLPHPNQPNLLVPMGFDFEKYPFAGAAHDPSANTFVYTVWDGGAAAITYIETSDEVEEALLREMPVAARFLPEFMQKMLRASREHSDAKVKSLSRSLIEDMAIDAKLLRVLENPKDKKQYTPSTERGLATILLYPKRARF